MKINTCPDTQIEIKSKREAKSKLAQWEKKQKQRPIKSNQAPRGKLQAAVLRCVTF